MMFYIVIQILVIKLINIFNDMNILVYFLIIFCFLKENIIFNNLEFDFWIKDRFSQIKYE